MVYWVIIALSSGCGNVAPAPRRETEAVGCQPAAEDVTELIVTEVIDVALIVAEVIIDVSVLIIEVVEVIIDVSDMVGLLVLVLELLMVVK